MNATELFLNLPAADASPNGLGNLLNVRPIERPAAQKLFQATFQKALRADSPNVSTTANGVKTSEHSKSAPAIGNANFTQKQDNAGRDNDTAAKSATVSAGSAAYRGGNRPSVNAQKNETPKQQQAQSETGATSENGTPAQAPQTAEAAAPEAPEAIAVEQGEEQADAVENTAVEILLEMLAALLQAAATDNASDATAQVDGNQAAPLDGLQLTFQVDKDSELYKQLSQLLNNAPEMSPEQLDQVKLMLQLADGKAIQISVSDLLTQAQGADVKALELSDAAQAADGGDKAVFTITLNAGDIANAQLAESAQTQQPSASGQESGTAKQAVFSLIVPAELLSSAAKDAKADASSDRIALAVEAGQAQAEEITKVPAAEQQIVLPLSANARTDKPKVATSGAKFLESDEFLKKLDAEALAKELSAAKAPKAELAERLERLMAASKPGETLAVMLGKDKTFEFVKNIFLQHDGASDKIAETRDDSAKLEWLKEQFRADLNPDRMTLAAASRKADAQAGDRIAFLGRPTANPMETFQKAVDQATADVRTPRNAELYQTVVDQVTSRIQFATLSAAGGEMRIFLRPEHLGDLQLKVRVDHDVVVAKFVAQSEQVKAIIESSLNQLRDSLAQAGIKAGKIVVTLDSGQQHQASADSGRHSAGSNHAHAEASQATAVEEPVMPNEELHSLGDDVIYGARRQTFSASRYSYLA